jgi:hypothetical protein
VGRRRHHLECADARCDQDRPAALRQRCGARPDAASDFQRERAVQWKSPEQGAATSVLLATSPLLEGVGGRYFEDCSEAGPNQPGTRRGVAAHALDSEAARRLWAVSEETIASAA